MGNLKPSFYLYIRKCKSLIKLRIQSRSWLIKLNLSVRQRTLSHIPACDFPLLRQPRVIQSLNKNKITKRRKTISTVYSRSLLDAFLFLIDTFVGSEHSQQEEERPFWLTALGIRTCETHGLRQPKNAKHPKAKPRRQLTKQTDYYWVLHRGKTSNLVACNFWVVRNISPLVFICAVS